MEANTNNVQEQINEINQKLDLVLHYVNEQRLKSNAVDDLVTDLSIITKDAFTSTVDELDKRGIELNVDDIKLLVFKFIRNVNNFSQMMDMLESLSDLLKDIGPMITEMGIDFTHKLHEFEQKGYFEFFKESANVVDKIITRYSPEDIQKLGDSLILFLDSLKNTNINEVTKYSLWKAFRELNSPEMKQGLGFIMSVLRNIAKQSISK